jgi:hypothetical protein
MFSITYNGKTAGAAQAVEQGASKGDAPTSPEKEIKDAAVALALATIAAQNQAGTVSVTCYGECNVLNGKASLTLRMEIEGK